MFTEMSGNTHQIRTNISVSFTNLLAIKDIKANTETKVNPLNSCSFFKKIPHLLILKCII